MADQSGQETKEVLSPRKKRTKEIIKLVEEKSALRSLEEAQKQRPNPIPVNEDGDSKIGLRILAIEAELKTMRSTAYLERVRKEQAALDNTPEVAQARKAEKQERRQKRELSHKQRSLTTPRAKAPQRIPTSEGLPTLQKA